MADDQWRQCAAWLTTCGVLRKDHKANWPDASIDDLALTLRDGVVLCNLLRKLDPACIDIREVNQKPQLAQFLCLRNIRIFIQVCRNYFDIDENDIFEPSMLFDFGDFFKVLHTLSKLSLCPKVQKRRSLKGFCINSPRTSSQEDIYKSLNNNDGVLMLPPRCPVGSEYEHRSYDLQKRNEEIYQDLCSIDKKLCIHQLATVKTEKRDYVVDELVQTEKNYVDVLATLFRCFMRPLSHVMKPEDFNIVFSGIKELSVIHRGFQNQLRKAVIPGSPIQLSDVFIAEKEKFLVYGEYCANLPLAQQRIQDLCTRYENINQEVIKCEEEAHKNMNKLRDILTVPMQRILKYRLFLEKLIDETQKTHEDYQGLVKARDVMVDVAEYINEVIRDSDMLQVMKITQASIVDISMKINHDLNQYGKLLKDGELGVKSHADHKTKPRYIFIFDQAVLMCKTVSGHMYSLKEVLYLKDYILEDSNSRRPIPRDTKRGEQHHWSLVSKSGSNCNYTMYAKNEALKVKWLEAIKIALDNIEPASLNNTDHKFQMHSFEKATTCAYCTKFLKGRIFQGYRCDDCYVAAHKQCIPNSGPCGPSLSLSLKSPRLPMDAEIPHTLRSNDWNSPSCAVHKNLSEYLWFVGEMGRERATSMLEREVDGTYLLRIRPQGPTHPNETIYALSLKTDQMVKHMKVYEKEMEGVYQYYLSHTRYFRSIVELICFYERTSLIENFIGLNVRLQWPFRRIIAVAEFDFCPTEANQLPLKQGCQVIVLSKEGEQKGWWKGKIDQRIGFFPKVYVREISDTLSSANANKIQLSSH